MPTVLQGNIRLSVNASRRQALLMAVMRYVQDWTLSHLISTDTGLAQPTHWHRLYWRSNPADALSREFYLIIYPPHSVEPRSDGSFRLTARCASWSPESGMSLLAKDVILTGDFVDNEFFIEIVDL